MGVCRCLEGQKVLVRSATVADRAEILSVHERAFGEEQGPEIADLVSGLLADETAAPVLSLAAEAGGCIVGHVLFTAVRVQPDRQRISAQILSPLAVLKRHQGEGVGRLLIEEGLTQLAASGVELVFVLGYPDYYSKFGFKPAKALGFDAPYPIRAEHEDAWMVQELKAGVIGLVQGRVQCAASLNEPRHWQE